MAHQSQHDNVALETVYNELENKFLQFEKNVEQCEDVFIVTQSKGKLAKALDTYMRVLHNDYTHRILLWRGEIMSVFSEAHQESEADCAKMERFEKEIENLLNDVESTITEMMHLTAKKWAKDTSTISCNTSPKVKRKHVINKAKASKV